MPQPVTFSKLERDPLHERIYRELRSAIISARFAPGEKLTVRSISSAFGVSTMPVRGAFSRLVAERAVIALANGTVAIPDLTREQFEDLVEIRLLLEGTATEKAVSSLARKDLAELKKIGAKLTAAAMANDAEAYLHNNRLFKFAIFHASGSPALEDLIERVWIQIGPFMRFYARDVRKQIDTDEHDAIIAALAAQDGPRARSAMERDIRGGAEYLLDLVEFFAPAEVRDRNQASGR